MRSSVLAATETDLEWLLAHMREGDRQELEGLSGLTSEAAARKTWQASEITWTFRSGCERAALFGLGRIRDVGVPWMLAGQCLDRNRLTRLEVARLCRGIIEDMLLARFDSLANVVDARQVRSIRWLKWCGFTVEAARPLGPHGLPFHLFWMRRAPCAA